MSKRGFTLIEVLAVIAILAILAVIAIPNVIKLYNNARKETFLVQAKNVLSSAMDEYTSSALHGETLANNIYCHLENDDYNSLNMTGDSKIYYKIILDKNGNPTSIKIFNNTFSVTASSSIDNLTISDVMSEGSTYYETVSTCDAMSYTPDECFTITSEGTITSYNVGGASCGTNVVIPNTINGITVLSIYGSWTYTEAGMANLGLTSVILPSTLQSIGIGAFYNNNLSTIIIPASVTNIHSYAFHSNSFENVTIKDKLSSAEFEAYEPDWSWGSTTCVADNTSNVTNGCVTWEE